MALDSVVDQGFLSTHPNHYSALKGI
jgi:hypothetical protein